MNWDAGRMLVNAEFSEILAANGLDTFHGVMQCRLGTTVRDVAARKTTRLELVGPKGTKTFYLKRHGRPGWRDRVMPWVNLSRPVLGAKNEWDAILRFHAVGLPTMIPVAFGEADGESFQITLGVEAKRNLLEFVEELIAGNEPGKAVDFRGWHSLRSFVDRVAEVARRMHEAGLHHQDFYLNHLLITDEGSTPEFCVIDLGRVRHRRKLALRWIIKDLSQLNYSARNVPCSLRLRFLRGYLGRKLTRGDRPLIRVIGLKSSYIEKHTRKNGL